MRREEREKYGIYIPELQTFMCIHATRKEFDQMLNAINSEKNKEAMDEKCWDGRDIGTFADFDYVVKEVIEAPYDEFCKELKEIDF